MSLKRFIEDLEEADDAEWALLERTIADARERSADLGFAIEACAIPRRFDAAIIGVLRAAPEDVEGNARLEAQLRDYSFVRRLEQGGCAYHDHTRELLLEHWRSEDRRLELEHLTWRLVAHYEAEHSAAACAADDAGQVSRMIAKASPERFAQLAGLLEAKLIAPLAEAISQLALLSAGTALAWAEQRFDAYEDKGRYSSCVALIRRTADIIAASPAADDTQEVLDWLTYWEGRELSRMNRASEAEATLQGLLDRGSAGTMLEYWTLGELGSAQKAQFKLREAVATYEREVALGERSEVDMLNLPLSYVRLGDAHLGLGEPDAAAEQFTLATAAADRADTPWPMFWSRMSTAQAAIDRGHGDEALHAALEALDIARTLMLDRRMPHGECSDLFAGYFGDEWPPLVDTAVGEGDALVAGLADPVELQRRRIAQAAGLRRSGQLRRARRTAAPGRDGHAAGDGDQAAQVTARARLELARLDEGQGHLKGAVEQYTASRGAAVEANATRLAIEALHRRGEAHLRLGMLDAAERDLAEAEEGWSTHGHTLLTALAQVHRSAVCRRRGDVRQAEAIIEPAARVLQGAAPGERIAYLWVRAEHDGELGRWAAARRAYEEIVGLAARMRRREVRARALTALAATASAQGAWGQADEHSRAAAQVYGELVEREGYRRSTRRRLADRMNAAGLRNLVSGDPGQLVRAAENFHGAIEKAPSPWYELNASYAAAALGDWDDAIEHLDRALTDAAWLRKAPLERRLGAHHVARGEGLMAAGEYAAAAEAFADSLQRLARPAQAESRARCLRGRGEALHALGDLDAAADTYRKARDAGDPAAPGRLGDVHAQRGEREEALKAFHSGLPDDDPQAAAALAERLIVSLEAPTRDELEAIVAAVAAAGGPAAAIALGDRLMAQDREEDAARAFTVVVEKSPVAAVRLANLRRATDPAAAREAYELALSGKDRAAATDAGIALGGMLAEQGDTVAAISAYRRALKAGGPEAPRAGYRLAELLRAAGELREAEFHLRSAVSAPDVSVAGPALIALGDLLVESGRRELAQDAYWRALEVDDVDIVVEAGAHLLQLFADSDVQWRRGEVFASVLRAGAKAALQLARRLEAGGARSTAAELLRGAANIADDLYAPDAALLLGSLLGQDGKREEADAAYWRALQSGDPHVAPEAAQRLMTERGGSTEPVDRVLEGGGLAALNLGDLLAKQGQTQLAERAYRRVAGDADDLFAADAALRLGDLLAEGGRVVEAEAAYAGVADSGGIAAATARERLHELRRRHTTGAEPEGVGA